MADHEEMRRRLEARRAKLTERTAKIERDLSRLPDPDSEERATERANDEVLEHLDAAERTEVQEIRSALARLEAGRYGRCERCDGAISAERLAALPATRTCVGCAAV